MRGSIVLEIEADAPDAFDALIALYRADERWNDLRALLERRTEVTLDDRVRHAALVELAALEESVLGQPGRAIAAHRRVLELSGDHEASYEALDRLYTAGEQWPELEELLARRADSVTGLREQVQLAYRRAELFAHKLVQPSRAVDLVEDVLGKTRMHEDSRELLEELLPVPEVTMRVARLLEPLYEQDKLWRDLVSVLRAQRMLVTGTEAVELLSRIATIEEAELSGARNAFDVWIEVIGLDPTHERARTEIARLAQQLGRWPEATAALEAAANAAPAGDVSTRAALLGELAAYYDVQLGDAPRAIASYRRLLELDASNPHTVRRAGAALARLYEEHKSWPELRAVMRKQSEWAEDPSERRALLARVAALEEDMLAEPTSAIATWRDILNDQPTDAGALNALERLYQGAEKWRELVDVLHRKLDHAQDPEAKQLLGRIAEIHEAVLGEPDEAIAAHLEVLDRDPSDRRALDELARLYRQADRHADLLDVLERQAQLDPANAAIHVEIARLLAGPLARPVEALERWSIVLQGEPAHPQALDAVQAALGEPDLRVMAADILRPVYGATNQHERLAQLQLRAADWVDDPGAKLRALDEVVRLREHQLGDKAGAFEALLLALRHAATEPELPRVLADVERVAGELGREADLIDAYREVAPDGARLRDPAPPLPRCRRPRARGPPRSRARPRLLPEGPRRPARRSPRAGRAREHLPRDQRRRAPDRGASPPGRYRGRRCRRSRRCAGRGGGPVRPARASRRCDRDVGAGAGGRPRTHRRRRGARGAVPRGGQVAGRRRSLRAPAGLRDHRRRGGRVARAARSDPPAAPARCRDRDR